MTTFKKILYHLKGHKKNKSYTIGGDNLYGEYCFLCQKWTKSPTYITK